MDAVRLMSLFLYFAYGHAGSDAGGVADIVAQPHATVLGVVRES